MAKDALDEQFRYQRKQGDPKRFAHYTGALGRDVKQTTENADEASRKVPAKK